MINFKDAFSSLFGGNQSQPKAVVQAQPKPQQQSFLGGVSNFVGNALPQIGNYIKQDFLRAPQIQTINKVAALPEVKFADKVKNPALRFGAQIGQDVLNSPRDTAQGLQGLGTDVSKVATGKPVRYQDVLYHGAQAAALPLNVIGGGGSKVVGETLLKQGFKDVLKQGFKTGGKIGLGYGAAQGAKTGKDINNPIDYATNLGANTLVGGTIGSLTGTGGAAVGYGVKKVIQGTGKVLEQRALEQFSNDMKDLTPKYLEDPAIKPFKKAFKIDTQSAREVANAITEVDKGNIGNGDVFGTFERVTKKYLPQFDNLTTPDKAKIWDYILARRYNLPTDNPVPPQLQGLDKAIFKVAGFDVRQGGFVNFGAKIGEKKALVNKDSERVFGIINEKKKAGLQLTSQEQDLWKTLSRERTAQPVNPSLPQQTGGQPLGGQGGVGETGKVIPGNSYAQLKGVDPESTVTVYRGVKESYNKNLSGGEWVTQDKQLANLYARNRARASGENARIISQKVKAKDLIIDPSTNPGVDDEFRYSPSLPQQTGGQPLGGQGVPQVPKGGNVPPSGNIADDLLKALDQAKTIRGQQDLGYSAERSQRFGEFSTALQPGGGKAGAKAALSKLGGELPKQQFEPLKLVPDVENKLYDTIAAATHLQPGEQASAIGGLDNMIGGVTPTETQIKALGSVFGKDFSAALNSKLSLGQRFYKNAADILNVPRAIQSSTDLSAPLRQGAVLAPSHPKEFAKAFKNMFGYAFSENKFMNRGKAILEHPNYPKAKFAGLSLTTPNAGLNQREEVFMSNLAERIPGMGKIIRGSDRAYTGFLNDLRFGTFNSLLKSAEKMGKGEDGKYLKDLAGFINNATGRGNLSGVPLIGDKLEQGAPLLNAAFFSPRLMASRMNLLNPGYYTKWRTFGGGADPLVRKEALKSMVAFTISGLSILGLAKLAGATVETDPTSADFGQIKSGNARYDIWAGFRPYANFVARMILGHQKSTTTGNTMVYGEGFKPTTKLDAFYRFFETKASPIASFGIDALRGKDFEGNKFDLKSTNIFTNPVSKRFIPLITSDVNDAIKEYGSLGPILTIPGLFGIGQAIYTPSGNSGVKMKSSIKSGVGTKLKMKPRY